MELEVAEPWNPGFCRRYRCLLLAVIATVVVVVLWEIVSRVPDDGTTAAEAVFALPPRGGSTGAAKFSVGLHGHRGPASNISYTV